MHTTHVIRGEEWLASLPLHLELFDAMGWPRINYAHLPVIMKLDEGKRRKLSKRKDPEADVRYFLKNGYPVVALVVLCGLVQYQQCVVFRMEGRDVSTEQFVDVFIKCMGEIIESH